MTPGDALAKEAIPRKHKIAFDADISGLPDVVKSAQLEPGLTYGFPITTNAHLSRIPPGFLQHKLVTNFSLDSLRKLCSRGLQISPRAGLSRWSWGEEEELDPSDQICFPWSIFEMHSHPTTCHFGALHSAIVALGILADLYTTCGMSTDMVPPVVFLTCTGPVISVWIAYLAEAEDGLPQVVSD